MHLPHNARALGDTALGFLQAVLKFMDAVGFGGVYHVQKYCIFNTGKVNKIRCFFSI